MHLSITYGVFVIAANELHLFWTPVCVIRAQHWFSPSAPHAFKSATYQQILTQRSAAWFYCRLPVCLHCPFLFGHTSRVYKAHSWSHWFHVRWKWASNKDLSFSFLFFYVLFCSTHESSMLMTITFWAENKHWGCRNMWNMRERRIVEAFLCRLSPSKASLGGRVRRS